MTQSLDLAAGIGTCDFDADGPASLAKAPMRYLRLLPFALAAGAILLLEACIALAGNGGQYNTDFFDFSPLQQDVLQRHVIYSKFMIEFAGMPSDALLIGDSSGFYGVQSDQVTAADPGLSFLNLGCCGDVGWTGFVYQSELALKQAVQRPKFLVLHVTPFWGPNAKKFAGDNVLAVTIRDYLLRVMWWHKVVIPSNGYRLRILNLINDGVWLDDFAYDSFAWPTLGYPPLRTWRQEMRDGRGWVPMPVDLKDSMVKRSEPEACVFDDDYSKPSELGFGRVELLYDYLKRLAELTEKAGARFVLVTNPVPCVVQPNDPVVADALRQLARFKAEYPRAIVPFDFFRQADLHRFIDRWHLNFDGGAWHSRAIGTVLREAGG